MVRSIFATDQIHQFPIDRSGNDDAAVMAAGHCGVGLGQTPNAVANMAAVIDKNGPAPTAWFVLPVVTVIFINIMNPIIITTFINLLA